MESIIITLENILTVKHEKSQVCNGPRFEMVRVVYSIKHV